MIKTKTFAAILPLMLALCSCAKQLETPQAGEPETAPVQGQLNIRIVSSQIGVRSTIAPDSGKESLLSEVQVAVFNESDSITAYRNLGAETSGTIPLPAGSYKVYAVANGPSVSGVVTLSQFNSVQAGLVPYNSGSDMIQVGSSTVTIQAGADRECSVALKRLAARIVLAKVENRLPEGYGAITLRSAFLSNVNCAETLDGASSSRQWANPCSRVSLDNWVKLGAATATAPDLTFCSIGASVSAAVPFESAQNFYCYKNPLRNAPREKMPTAPSSFPGYATLLTLETVIGGNTYYYPVNIAEAMNRDIVPNSSYAVSVSLHNLGSSDPGVPVELGNAVVSVSVDNWDNGGQNTVEI